MSGMKGVTMAKVKAAIWDIDTKRFNGEVKGAKGRMLMMYHRDAVGTVLPYNVDVDHRFKTIHIGAPGDEKQIDYLRNLYGLKSAEEVVTAIAEDILVNMAYEIYELPKDKKNDVLRCTIDKLFNRRSAELPELVLDVWSVVMDHMKASDIRGLAELSRDLHTMAAKMINSRRQLIMTLRDAYQRCPDEAGMAIIKRDVPKYPLEVSYIFTIDLIEKQRCPELLLLLKNLGIDLLNHISKSLSVKYRRDQSDFLQANKIYTKEELEAFNKRYIREKAKDRKKPIKQATDEFNANYFYM